MKARHCPPFETSSKPQSLVDEDSNNASNLLPPVEEEEDDPNLSDDDMEECQVVVDEFALKRHQAVEDGKIYEPTPKEMDYLNFAHPDVGENVLAAENIEAIIYCPDSNSK